MSDPKDFAPGAPGMDPHRAKPVLSGLGASFSASSRVTFTLSSGIISEVGYPDAASPCAHDLQWIVTDGAHFFSEEQRHTAHEVSPLEEGIPAYRITNTCHQGKYKLVKEIVTDPLRDTLLQKTTFSARSADPYHLYILLNPFIGAHSDFHNARVSQYKGTSMLIAQKGDLTLALACSHPWKTSSVGFSGISDGWMDLAAHRRLIRQYNVAESGRVSMVAEIDLFPTAILGQASRAAALPDQEIILALAFGDSEREAASNAWASLLEGFEPARERYLAQWRAWQRSASTTILSGSSLAKQSFLVLRWLESKIYPGAFLSAGPFAGPSAGAGTPGPNAMLEILSATVCPRHLAAAFDAYLASDGREEALRLLSFLIGAQEPAGSWPLLLHADGTSGASLIALDQVAQVILMVDTCRKHFLLPPAKMQRYWPLVWKAAAFLVSSGPHFGTDRWNEAVNPSLYTLCITVAALLAAADMADERQQPGIATYCRKTADYLQANIDQWTFIHSEHSEPQHGPGFYTASAVAPGGPSPDALALVHFGLRKADDPRILQTLKAVDAALKVETPYGPIWQRTPFISDDAALLTAERAMYELNAGNREIAGALLKTLEGLTTNNFFPGSSNTGLPDGRAHAAYLKLSAALTAKNGVDQPRFTVERYLQRQSEVPFDIWRIDHPCATLPKGKKLRIEVPESALIHWTDDAWTSKQHTLTRDTYLDVHVAELSPRENALKLEFTFFWLTAGRWENKNYTVTLT